jgi:N-acetylglucosaminyldiphosphoundecaprenol N-acetyl-beta-D-mannosaminyltransferase
MNQQMDLPVTGVNILGVRVSTLPLDAVVDFIVRSVLNGDRAVLAYANVHAINLAQELPWFRSFLNEAALTYCDGFGVKWGAWLLGARIPERFTPPDWFPTLASACATQGISFYFLGARPGIAEKCAARLRERQPDLKILGSYHGYFNKTPGSAENQEVISAINAAAPDILVVGFGMPMQERWLVENWSQIQSKIALPVGAMFDYLAGEVQRAPRWMTDRGFEWLGRLFFEPRRLAHRYLIGNPGFLWRVLKQRYGVLPPG